MESKHRNQGVGEWKGNVGTGARMNGKEMWQISSSEPNAYALGFLDSRIMD